MRFHGSLYPRSRLPRTIATRPAADIPNFTPFTSSGDAFDVRAGKIRPRREPSRFPFHLTLPLSGEAHCLAHQGVVDFDVVAWGLI